MRSLFKTLLGIFTLGAVAAGCSSRPESPPASTDVTLLVPGMN
jgi:hypothetical protein